MIVGDNQKFIAALITPSVETLMAWCKEQGITWTNLSEMLKRSDIMAKYQEAVDEINPNFGHIEQVKKFILLPVMWEPVKTDGSESELTPTMKLKRRVILEKFREEISTLYF
jgi:long-chain acyl-CoA synthetase